MSGNNKNPDGLDMPEECTGDELGTHQEHQEPIIGQNVFPLVAKENEDAFQALAEEFAIAERRMKAAEWIEGTDVPSINELRYVGYHIFKACTYSENPAKQREELRRAKRHCKRASFDAMELGIIFQLEQVKSFKQEFRDFVVSDVIPDYLEKLTRVQQVQKFLEDSTGKEDRDQYYSECETHLDALKEINNALFAAREETLKKRSSVRKKTTLAIAGLAVAIAAAAGGIWGAANGTFQDKDCASKTPAGKSAPLAPAKPQTPPPS